MLEPPKHISWSVNNVPYATFKQFLDNNTPLKKFKYSIEIDKNIDNQSFRNECINAAKLLPDNLAIPLSGSDSEIVARSVKLVGKQATVYYEDYPWA